MVSRKAHRPPSCSPIWRLVFGRNTPDSRGLTGYRLPCHRACSHGVVEDDTERIALAGAYPAHAMAQVDAIHAACALHRPMMDREDHAFSLAERHYLSAR